MLNRLIAALAGRRPAPPIDLPALASDIEAGRHISRNPRIDVAWQCRAYTQACKWQPSQQHATIARRLAEGLAADFAAGRYVWLADRGCYILTAPTPTPEGERQDGAT